MLEQELGKDIPLEDRAEFLKSNCDKVEEVSYSKAFSPQEMAKQRELLTDASIKLSDLENEKKLSMESFKEQMKPYQKQKEEAIQNLKTKAQLVTENCYKFFDEETKMIGFYNKEGDLVSSRSAFPDELEKTIFADLRNGTTNNN